ncbi:MAG: polysaccharide export protein [bacterium]|nr:polysaccharide export protein [bacterium]
MKDHTQLGVRLAVAIIAVAALSSGCQTVLNAVNPVEQRATVPTAELLGEEAAVAQEARVAKSSATDPGDVPYAIGPGDMLEFRSFDDPTLNQEVQVRFDGTVSLPLVPDVRVAGKTRDEALGEIEAAYTDVFKEPQIALTVRATESKTFYVLGDVMQPSEYPYRRTTTVLQAINVAGGQRFSGQGDQDLLSQQGTLTKAFVIRGCGEDREIVECDLRGLTEPGAHPSDTPVFPGDFVYVPEGVNLVYVLGEVRQPSVFQLAEGQTLTQLLARAGSPTASTARMRHVVLIRPKDAQNADVMVINLRKVLRSGHDTTLRAGDIVYVPRRPLVRIEEFVNRFTGSISPLLSLYSQAWETKYTKKRLEVLYDVDEPGDMVNTLQNIEAYGQILQGYTTSLPQPPPLIE